MTLSSTNMAGACGRWAEGWTFLLDYSTVDSSAEVMLQPVRVHSVDCLVTKNIRMVDDSRSCGDMEKVRNTAGAHVWDER